jgi:glucokinase
VTRNIAAAIDFGGTKTLVGLVDDTGEILAMRRFSTKIADLPEIHFARCARFIEECLHESNVSFRDQVLGVGVTVPGLADSLNGLLIHAPYAGWRNVSVKSLLQSHWPNVSVSIANDVNACALGEMFFGKTSYKNMLWVTVSTGIGGGLIVGGRMVEGEQGIAGELGHVVVEWEHPNVCGCGNRGCLEAHASGTAIAREAQKRISYRSDSRLAAYFTKRAVDVTAKHLAEAALNGIEEAKEIYRKAGTYLGRALSYAINLLNPGCIVIGGGVSLSWELMEPSVKEIIKGAVIGERNKRIPIIKTDLGYEAGLKGAASLVFSNQLEG